MAKLACAVFVIAALFAGTARAETATPNDPERMIREGAQRILEGVREFIDRIPQYAAPEFLPNGDIIIRKLPPGSGFPWFRLQPGAAPEGALKT